MSFEFRALLTANIFVTLALFPLTSHAINISAFRIYLDESKPTTSFRVHNPDAENQSCSLRLKHYNFDENSEMVEVEDGKTPENSASAWIRFSPKKFTLIPTHSQTIRFTKRKKAKADPAEYRSYLVIDCEAVSDIDKRKRLISVKPKLLHNVPVIVRNGDLDAKVTVKNIEVNGNQLSFSVERDGSRSVYGDIEIVNKNTDDILSTSKGFSIYPESSRHLFSMGIKGENPENLKIRFKENIHYGGNLVYETNVTP